MKVVFVLLITIVVDIVSAKRVCDFSWGEKICYEVDTNPRELEDKLNELNAEVKELQKVSDTFRCHMPRFTKFAHPDCEIYYDGCAIMNMLKDTPEVLWEPKRACVEFRNPHCIKWNNDN